ncbi:MAG: hypothetical protein ACT6RZ_10275 [Methylophilus sp.]|uniref:hypothetical protein n=1 Tax=Methylophilus sp. TaxID=29541 RepID=UPI0040371F62
MKLLKIDENDGFFLDITGQYRVMSKITKEDILRLVNMILDDDHAEFDLYNEEGIKNQAHQIIYKSVVAKLLDLQERRQEFIDESQRLFLTEYEKYSTNH